MDKLEEEQIKHLVIIKMLTAACTNLCNAKADFGSDADTLSTDVRPNIDPGCGGGKSRTMVTASKAVCFPSGPAPTRHVWNWNGYNNQSNQTITNIISP